MIPKKIPVNNKSSYLVNGELIAFQIGRMLIGYAVYKYDTPDWTILGEIKLSDLYGDIDYIEKLHNQGIWTSLNNGNIRIGVNINYHNNSQENSYSIFTAMLMK